MYFTKNIEQRDEIPSYEEKVFIKNSDIFAASKVTNIQIELRRSIFILFSNRHNKYQIQIKKKITFRIINESPILANEC